MIKNLTPHPIMIVGADADNEVIATIQPEPTPARLKTTTVPAEPVDGIATSRTVFGNPSGLPEAVEGTFLIVSQIIKSALPSRADLLVPAEVIRDKSGNIIGCRSLGR